MAKLFGKKKKSEDTSEDYHKQLLSTVKQVRKDTKKVRDKMTRSLRLFEGDMWDMEQEDFKDADKENGRSGIMYNVLFAIVQQIAPMVTANRPITRLAPRKPFLWKLGEKLNHVLKYSWEALDMQMQMFRAVIDSMVMGMAVFKLGWSEDKKFGGENELTVVDPRDFFIAPGYEEIWKAPWCGIVAPKPISWVRRQFPDVKEITPDGENLDDKTKAYKFGDTPNPSEDTKFVTIYEMWIKDDQALEEIVSKDKDGNETKEEVRKYPYGKMCFFTEKEILDTVACKDEHGLPPYVEMWDYIRPHNFIGMSEVDQIEGLHREVNVLLKYIAEYTRRKHAPNFLVDISQMQDDSFEAVKDRLTLGNQYIPWDSQGGQKEPPIKQIDDGQLNPQIMNLLSFILEVIDVVSGVNDVNRGNVGKQERQSASEVAILKEASDTRTMQRSRNLEWSLKRIEWMLASNTMQYAEQPRDISYEDKGERVYTTYGNSSAQAKEAMQPAPLSPSAQDASDSGMPMVGLNAKEMQRYEQEMADYEQFMEWNKDSEGEFDRILFDFDIEIQTDSTLPTDKQSRANLFLRLKQLESIDVLSLLEQMQIPGAQEIVKRLKEERAAAQGGGGGQEQALMAANPEAAAKFKQAQGA